MSWLFFVLGTVVSWGMYGPTLHKGQVKLGNPLRALVCVGVAYFLIGVLVPLLFLGAQGEMHTFPAGGVAMATLAGTLGAIGAVCIIYSFKHGGLPAYVMPLVFGGAPVVNVLASMWIHPPRESPNVMLYAGFAMAAIGAALVLRYRPS